MFYTFLFSIIMLGQETKEQIAERLKPEKSELIHTVIQQDIWGNKDVIIAFYETRYIDSISGTEPYERQFVEGYLYLKKNKDYTKVLISKFEDDNVDTNITSVFFANADKDSEKELIILSTVVHRLQYLYDGTEYTTSVFNDFKIDKIPKELVYLSKISKKLSGGFEGFLETEGEVKAKIKTAEDVRKKLKQLGY